ncbi:stress protein [Arthrobacter sp. ZBG10]|uniref:Asp23/Gls24 family envelope stress response protein n=1 Tax=Micrococcaceae TaxID=1268 RepID=UPI000682C8C8|nr:MULTISPECIES: Asp23/Gls24 family envelope stress response protein [Micrococcaceae]KNH13389.1 stress protein [Arthrobacter sp. ZBG10]KQQ92365.1 stress protein [Arthrobacter sp. Leaf141]
MTTQPQTPSDVQKKTTAPGHELAAGEGHDGRGKTTVADGVVAKIAGIAIQEIEGVHALGGGAARALGNLREKVGQKDLTQGVTVEVGQTQVAVDVTLVVEYPHPLQQVADRARDAVYTAVEDLVGMEVTEVNITITDIHVASEADNTDDDDAPREPRVA